MKNYSFALLCALTIAPVAAKVGCLDNSMHLEPKKYDYKEYHYVACNCPCSEREAKRDKCLRCKHSHKPQPMIIVDGSSLKAPAQQSLPITAQNPHTIMQTLIQRYKKRD